MQWTKYRTEQGVLSVARFCYVFPCELRGPASAVGSYKYQPISQGNFTKSYLQNLATDRTPHSVHYVASGMSWYFVKLFSNVPLAIGLIQHILCSPIGDRNFRKKQNITSRQSGRHRVYRAGHPICHKVLKIMFWEVPPADWLILWLPTAQAGPRNSHRKT